MIKLISMSKKLKVLYVEDNKEAREQTLKLLYNFFDKIDIAQNGQEGLSKYIEQYDKYQHHYDLVISDIAMPVMDGIEMCRQMKQLNHIQPVLIVSAYNESEKLQQLIDIGIDDFVNKPIDTKVFFEKISKITNQIEERKKEKEKLNEIEKLNQELDAMIDSFDTYVIASRTDLKGIITYASKAYEDISGYTKEELIGKPHNIVRHPDMPKSAFRDMWHTIKQEKLWVGEVKNLKKDGSFYWVKAYIAPYYDKDKKHVGYSAIRLDITAQKRVEELHKKVNLLLDNAGEGFLSFDKNFKCEDSYSKECLKIFKKDDIAGLDISELLFENNNTSKNLFRNGIKNIIDIEDDLSKDLILSLFPKELKLHGKNIRIDYKILDGYRFMLVIQDITETKQLKKKIDRQNMIQKMIVSVVSNQEEFVELKSDFEKFITNPPKDKDILLRKLHTFKGIFAQKDMLYISNAIHDLESKIKDTALQDISKVFDDFNLKAIFEKDIKIIDETLGENFLKKSSLKVDVKELDNIIEELEQIKVDKNYKDSFDKVIHRLKGMRYTPLYHILKQYSIQVEKVAKKLDKLIYPLQIEGDKEWVLPKRLKPFVDSLVHLFNNCVDHGVKEGSTREKMGKDIYATIKCAYKIEQDKLYIDISDDGSGIDIDKVVSNAIDKNIINSSQSKDMSEDEKLSLIFADNLSTKDSADMLSGRGVGMSAIKNEIEKIDGNIKIQNKINKGVSFAFVIPLLKEELC